MGNGNGRLHWYNGLGKQTILEESPDGIWSTLLFLRFEGTNSTTATSIITRVREIELDSRSPHTTTDKTTGNKSTIRLILFHLNLRRLLCLIVRIELARAQYRQCFFVLFESTMTIFYSLVFGIGLGLALALFSIPWLRATDDLVLSAYRPGFILPAWPGRKAGVHG